MASHDEITAALEDFAARYAEDPRLKTMNKDWNRVIHIKADDTASEHTLRLQDGELTVSVGLSGEPQMVLTADSETLADLFYGDISPTEPYMNGKLKLQASEADIMRLDVITLMLWDE